jgi:hypothetical protein
MPLCLKALQAMMVTMMVALLLATSSAVQASPGQGALSQAEVARRLSAPGLARALTSLDKKPGVNGHPRLFGGQRDHAGIVAAARQERRPGMAALADTLKRHSARTVSSALEEQIYATDQATRMASWWQQVRLLEGMAESAFVWYVERDPWYLDELKARLHLLGPAVLTRECSGDVAETRDYVWYFALAYDLAYAGLDDDDRELVHEVATTCARASLARTIATVRSHPDNGIAFNALGKFVGAMLILRGDVPEARRWLERALPAYVGALSPWGGDDGGFANGSTYALWDAGESLLVWDLIERVLDLPIYRKPWLEHLIRYVVYALPPSAPAGAFGDGAEVKRREEWARLGKALAYRSSSALAQWYARALNGEDPARLHLLLSPRARRAGPEPPKATADGAAFPSIGVAAMHSSLDDPDRTTLLFKSSPFGSINHSHADQNSFVLYARGQVLAMDSGHYDAYASPHWRGWYKHTRAHNAITYDGGQGQSLGPSGLGDRKRAGRLERFQHARRHDLAVGVASEAYGDGVTLARRSVMLIRPGTVVIIDQLASRQPRRWEWNLHTQAPLEGEAEHFETAVNGVRLCGTVQAQDDVSLTVREGYKPPPSVKAGPHYWNRVSLRAPSAKATFVAVLRVDCNGAAPDIHIGETGTGQVSAAGMKLRIDPAGVTVDDSP